MHYAAPLSTEMVFFKSTNSPFIQTNLHDAIASRKIKRLVVAGLMTAHCVSTTMRMASNLHVVEHTYGSPHGNEDGRSTLVLVRDGTATFDVSYGNNHYDAETVHAVHLATMKDEFCDVESTREVIARLEARR